MKVLHLRNYRRETPEAAPDEGPTGDAALGDGQPPRYDRITVRAITVAIVLSLFVHVTVLIVSFMPKSERELRAPADEIGPLSVTIAQSNPQPRQKPAEPQPEPRPTPDQPRPPKAAVRPRPAPPRPTPQIALNRPSTGFVVPPPAPTPPPPEAVASAPAPDANQDFSEQIAQRQRARRAQNGGAPDEQLESDDQRAKRIAMANIAAQQRSASPGQDPNEGGGIFQMQRTGLHDAEFLFRGWNKAFRRSMAQHVEVRQGSNPDIRIAVIRRMIEIIREQKPGDFEWESHRLGKVITMSARPKDQAQLEAFLMKEFYPEDARAR